MKNNHRPKSPIKFRFKEGKRNVDDLLNPEVLDDETRKLLLQDVLRSTPAKIGENTPRKNYTQATQSHTDDEQAGLKRHLKQQRSAGTDINGDVERAPGPSSNSPSKADYPSQLRSRVSNSSNDLVTVMATRLADLERKQKFYEMELAEQRNKYQLLQTKYDREVKKRDEAENVVITLYEEKKDLENELRDIKQFLSDYGLHWKGSGEGRSSRQGVRENAKFDLYAGDFDPSTPRENANLEDGDLGDKSSQDSGPINFNNTAQKGTKLFDNKKIPSSMKENEERAKKCSDNKRSVDIELLKRNARILSDYVGYKENCVQGNRGGIRLRDVVKFAVYANGIVVNNGPLRPFGWPLCEAFLKDIEEGFYPYEFKEKYPSGFPIEVVDKSNEVCDPEKKNMVSKPQGGRRLGGGFDDGESNAGGSAAIDGSHAMSREEILKKLPTQHITAEGKIINLREGVSKFIEGDGSDTKGGDFKAAAMGTVKHVSAAESNYQEEKEAEDNTDKCKVDLVAILLRLPNGQKITLKMALTNTIEELRRELILAFPAFKEKKFELCQAFPSLTFDDHTKTLQSLGLVRSCTLMVRFD